TFLRTLNSASGGCRHAQCAAYWSVSRAAAVLGSVIPTWQWCLRSVWSAPTWDAFRSHRASLNPHSSADTLYTVNRCHPNTRGRPVCRTSRLKDAVDPRTRAVGRAALRHHLD
ncbi:hypothetical protein DPEC_G00148650, partial [Dallia pectoralis]